MLSHFIASDGLLVQNHKTALRGNRKDIISLLTITYRNSFLVWAANPIDFKHFSPTRVIINIFLYQLPGRSEIDYSVTRGPSHLRWGGGEGGNIKQENTRGPRRPP